MYCELVCTDKNGIVYEDKFEITGDTLVEGYHWLLGTYGRCISKMHIDGKRDGEAIHVGYVFERRGDDREVYQYWIRLFTSKKTVYEYPPLAKGGK